MPSGPLRGAFTTDSTGSACGFGRSRRLEPGRNERMVVVARGDHDLASGKGGVHVLGEFVDRLQRTAHRRFAQLDQVAEDHQAVDVLGGLEQPLTDRGMSQEVVSGERPQVQIRDHGAAHTADHLSASLR